MEEVALATEPISGDRAAPHAAIAQLLARSMLSSGPDIAEVSLLARRCTFALGLVACVVASLCYSVPARAQTVASAIARQSLDDAWWTGPMLANSAATLPRGHVLIEPYFFDVIAPRSNAVGSSAFLLYGLVDELTVGMLPSATYAMPSGAPSSSRVGLGDLTLLAQYRLTKFHTGSWIPAMAVNVQQSFPTAPYDRLGDRTADGFGSGVYTTTVALNTQTYFWLANGRILRLRVNASEAMSSGAHVDGVSVYGTAAGFDGRAEPGSVFVADAAAEYSLTKRWVLALDIFFHHSDDTRVTDHQLAHQSAGQSNAPGFAPAIEYNWKSTWGILVGARVIPESRNTTATITPAIAVNFVH
jgi:hypothetical protein